MQILFAWDVRGEKDAATADQIVTDSAAGETAQAGVRRRAREMADGAWEMREMVDQWVVRLAPKWPTKRQPGVDRSLLRLAIWELTSSDTPPKVVLDEAIEMAKEYSTLQSPAFVNGVLDAILKEHQALKAEVVAVEAAPIDTPVPVDTKTNPDEPELPVYLL